MRDALLHHEFPVQPAFSRAPALITLEHENVMVRNLFNRGAVTDMESQETLEAKMARTLIQMSIAGATGAVMLSMITIVMAFTGAFA